ncbi:hypothetical protein HYN59_13560 [Flavobacterium album]|uniref:Secretion system C-terminal sorting domain-containing protein n=1 Tax=Flavobacterium album TaxID=2175091 RepID=A0A2S1R0C9_9FLAO|nr:T9SS type A sorting domain-containing protein [Flavobacterium album]AWH86075.1 hypothetical protein HYN59_13560 [Flavobacterium album]
MSKKHQRSLNIGKFLMIMLSFGASAQVQNNGSLYIAEGGVMYIANSGFAFGAAPAQTATSRASSNGVLAFAGNATWSNASAAHFVDGYIRYYGTSPFIAPVGDNIYAPAGITPSDNSGVDAAYFNEAPSAVGTALNSAVSAISGVEYWKISGAGSSVISLTWRASSGLSSMLLTPSLSYITIAGYNGSEWVEIPSFFDNTSILGGTSSVTVGSVTSLGAVNLSGYQAFTIAVKENASCFPMVASSGNTKVWNGTDWLPGAPGLNDPVVINQPYSDGSFSCYSVTLNADITLADGDKLEVANGFSGTGKVIMSSGASLLQRSPSGVPPAIEMTKVTNPMRRFDYVFLSSPLNDFATFFQQINSPANVAVNGAFGTYPLSSFYNLYTDGDANNSVTVTASNVPVGRGFAATVDPLQGPYAISNEPHSWDLEKYPVHIKAAGTANNGTITVPVPTAAGWVRIGNPYPSPMNAEKLLDAMGDNFRKTIYFWTYNSPRQSWANVSGNYNAADYAIFNYTGGVAACPTCQVPTGYVATMQSVYVRKLNPGAITFSLTNCLRELDGNNNFFRTAQNAEGKYRINMSGATTFSQVLVAYDADRTYGYDNGYDSARMPGGLTSELNTMVEGQNSGYAIQTRPAFEINDVVPVQVVQRADEVMSLSLVETTGVFQSGTIGIYVHDKVLDVYHNLGTDGPYTFVQPQGTDNARFEIVYMDESLGTNDLKKTRTVAYTYNKYFNAQSGRNMAHIEIYDLAGRLVEEYGNINATSVVRPFNHAQAVYLAKIKMEDGTVVSQKLINY